MFFRVSRLMVIIPFLVLIFNFSSMVYASESISVDDPQEFIDVIKADPSANISLAKDLNFILLDINSNTLISSPFRGVINGNGYAIKNLDMTLFSKLENATITNLIIDEVHIYNNGVQSIFANQMVNTTVDGLTIINSSINSRGEGGVGSVAGKLTSSTLSNISVVDTRIIGWQFVGGFMGRHYGTSNLSNINFTATVTGNGYSVGGFIGRNEGTLNISNSIITPLFNPHDGNGGKGGFQGNGNGSNTVNFNHTFVGVRSDHSVSWFNHLFFNSRGNGNGTSYEWANTPFKKQASSYGFKSISNENINDNFFASTLTLSPDFWNIQDTSINQLPTLKSYDKVTDYFNRIPALKTPILTVSEYDQQIKDGYTLEMTQAYEMLLMQRNLVNNIGHDYLCDFSIYDASTMEFINWLMNDYNNLHMYTMGGSPDGKNYRAELQVLYNLYKEYHSDFEISTITPFNNVQGDVYKKMAFSIAKGYSITVRFWTATGNVNSYDHPSVSHPVVRYQIYKDFYNNGRLGYQVTETNFVYSNQMFENMQVEEMRYVLNAHLDDPTVKWFNWYIESDLAAKNEPKYNNNLGSRRNPYTYMDYRYMDYYQDKFSNPNNYDMWNEKYQFSQFGITELKKESPKIWVVFEEGGICWPISKVGSNIWSVLGTPANAVSQPGHLAYVYSSYKSETDKMYWGGIYNSLGGWGITGEGGPTAMADKFHVRMPLEWGDDHSVTGYNASYLALSQENLNNFDAYADSQMVLLLSSVYKNDTASLESIYRKAIALNPRDYEAWLSLTKLYRDDTTKTHDELYGLLTEISNNLDYAPLPMYDLFRLLKNRISDSHPHLVKYNMLLEANLKRDRNVSWQHNLEHQAVGQTAKHLLNEVDTVVATFSLDGNNANKIILSEEKFGTSGVTWEYSLDGAETWIQVESNSILLTPEEIASLNHEDNLKIHILGVDYSADNIYTIDLTKGNQPTGLYVNELENRVIGSYSELQYLNTETNTWDSYYNPESRFEGTGTIQVRTKPTKTTLASDSVTYHFTANPQPANRKYIYVENISTVSTSPPYNNDKGGNNLIDANPHGNFYSTTGGEKFLTYKFKEPVKLSAMEYLPYGANLGRFKVITLYGSMDGNNFEKIQTFDHILNNTSLQNFEITNPVELQYIKIVVDQTYNNSLTANMLNFFEDTTEVLTGEVTYSTTDPTNQDVVATITVDEDVTITNNEGSNTYTFTDNGTFTFDLEKNGNVGSVIAEVNNIDKTPPTANIIYGCEGNTIVAKLVEASEDITITNNDGSNLYLFKNGAKEFTFEFEDIAGNKSTAMASIESSGVPTAELSYSTTEPTNQDVVVEIIVDEGVTIVNNDGLPTHTFTENGSFTFEIEKNEMCIEVVATVSNIDKVAPIVKVHYEKVGDTIVASLVDPSEDIIVTNNDGNLTYTFTENGEFTFEFEDKVGNKNTALAKVSDFVIIPTGEVTYSTTDPTNQDVVATITVDEDVTITNNEGSNTYTFTDNGTFTFNIERGGATNAIVATVSNIDKVAPIATVEYIEKSNSIIAKVSFNEAVLILNNDGKNIYEFTKNGNFQLNFQDLVGNTNSIQLVVDSIEKEPAIPTVPEEPKAPEESQDSSWSQGSQWSQNSNSSPDLSNPPEQKEPEEAKPTQQKPTFSKTTSSGIKWNINEEELMEFFGANNYTTGNTFLANLSINDSQTKDQIMSVLNKHLDTLKEKYEILSYKDIFFELVIDGKVTKVTKLNKPIELTIDLDKIAKEDCVVFEITDGKINQLADLDHIENTVTIKTDNLSSIVIAQKAPENNLLTYIIMITSITVILIVALAIVFVRMKAIK